MKKIILLITALLLVTTHAAQAQVFVWIDPLYAIKVTFPDNWMRQAQLDDDMRLSILAPQGNDHAACRLYVKNDGRYRDAPAYEGGNVSNFVFSSDAVRNQMVMRPDTDNVHMASFSPQASLGPAPATLSEVDFQKNWGGKSYAMHAMVLASQYQGRGIFMSCETLASSWSIWADTINRIFRSVDFPSAFTASPNGLYRPFVTQVGYSTLPKTQAPINQPPQAPKKNNQWQARTPIAQNQDNSQPCR